MVETNPVHPNLRRDVQQAIDEYTDAKVKPTETSRDGVIKVFKGLLNPEKMDDYMVAGISSHSDKTLIHVERA